MTALALHDVAAFRMEYLNTPEGARDVARLVFTDSHGNETTIDAHIPKGCRLLPGGLWKPLAITGTTGQRFDDHLDAGGRP